MINYYIYIYLDPRKNGQYCYDDVCFLFEPIYVGKGKDRRYLIKNNRNKYFKNKINKIKKVGLKPVVIKLYENLNEEESFEKEIQLIKEIGRNDLNLGSLLNMTDGGEGSSNYKHTIETRNKISEKVKGENNPNFGKPRLEEIKKKISEKKKNKHHSEYTKQKIRKYHLGKQSPMFGKYHSEESKKKISESNTGKNIGENNPRHKLTEEQVIQIKLLLKEGKLSQKIIAKIFGVSPLTISAIKTGKIWNHIKI